MSTKVYVRDIQNYMIKPSDNGGLKIVVDYVTHTVLISYTTLRSFIPPQVSKITPKLRQICGCELCIITNDMQIDLKLNQEMLGMKVINEVPDQIII